MATDGARAGNGGGGAGSDQLTWYFFRFSGVLLIGLVGGHVFITHYLNRPSETTFDFVAARWANHLWRTYDWLLLILALWHGLLGARIAATDYIRDRGKRLLAYSIIWAIGLVFTVLGSATIVMFDEEAARHNTGPLADAFWLSDLLGYALYAVGAGTYIATALLLVWVVRNKLAGNALIYEGDSGQYAWVLHRATGLGIIVFLLVHILDIALVALGRDVYNHMVAFYGQPFIIPMEIALVGAVLYHTLNGIRVTLIDFWSLGVKHQRAMYYLALIGSVLLTLPSAILLIAHEF